MRGMMEGQRNREACEGVNSVLPAAFGPNLRSTITFGTGASEQAGYSTPGAAPSDVDEPESQRLRMVLTLMNGCTKIRVDSDHLEVEFTLPFLTATHHGCEVR